MITIIYYFKVIKKAIGVAVYTLPETASFLNEIAKGIEKSDLNVKLFEASVLMDKFYDQTEKLFIENKLEAIP